MIGADYWHVRKQQTRVQVRAASGWRMSPGTAEAVPLLQTRRPAVKRPRELRW